MRIRLTDERWAHVTEEHAEMAGRRQEGMETLAQPDRIVTGGAGERLALKKQPDGKILVAVYREDVSDGFLITAFLTRREEPLNRKQQLWPAPKSPSS